MGAKTYEDLGAFSARRPNRPTLLEGWRGSQVVEWYGSIERQLESLQREASAAENKDVEAKVYAYLKTWRENELTGSVNVETVNALLAGSSILAVDRWNLSNYFSQLRDQLRRLKSSLEELPVAGFDAQAAGSFSPRASPSRLEPPSTGLDLNAGGDIPPLPNEAPEPATSEPGGSGEPENL